MRTTVNLSILYRKNVFLLENFNKYTIFLHEMDKLTVVLIPIKWLDKIERPLVKICRHGWVSNIRKKLLTSFMDGSYDVSMHELIRGQNSYCCAWRALKFNDFESQWIRILSGQIFIFSSIFFTILNVLCKSQLCSIQSH